MKIRRWHKLRRSAAYLAILGLLLQSALVVLHASSAFAALASGEAGDSTTIICTGHGFERVAVDEADGSLDGTGTPTLYKSCPGCLGITGAPAMANAIVLPVPSGQIVGENYVIANSAASGRLQSAPRNRGPPLQT